MSAPWKQRVSGGKSCCSCSTGESAVGLQHNLTGEYTPSSMLFFLSICLGSQFLHEHNLVSIQQCNIIFKGGGWKQNRMVQVNADSNGATG
ncbi:hypothetical protein XELAEV_18005263mg [Xenopus laevis]|uniref:Uncharacterized protein n=1 Tax=Xenopus laevis TaxID=8355 RepID=A0A974I2G7_XENLA|nr:hypothetical protein XELAEV_18005263mg [Xenopus laevis]